MNLQVFGCPNCEQPFQVSLEQAGQVVQCPSCAQQVKIPADAFGEVSPAESASVEPQQIFACPSCSGQFGITPEMVGQHVGCPHCQSSIMIQIPEPDPETIAPEIGTDRPVSKEAGKKKSARKPAAPNPEASKDLFAPGFKGKTKSVNSEMTGATGDKSPPTKSDPPTADTKPDQAGIENDPGKEKEKKRWRSPKRRRPNTGANPNDRTPPQPMPPRSEVDSTQTTQEMFRDSTSLPDDSKTKRQALDATVDLEGRQDHASDDRTALKKPNIVEASVVEATVAETPAAKKELPAARVDQGPAVEAPAPGEQEAERLVEGEPGMGRADHQPADDDEAETGVNPPDHIDHLLPPRFEVLDPTQMRVKSGRTHFKVILPDGKGGMAQVDQRIVRVEHEGERISLLAMTPEQRSQRRLIQNIIAIIIGIVIMAIAFWILK